MKAFDEIVERRIIQAMERGELDDLPGAGAPLVLDDDALVPEEQRMATRILKNAGVVPREVELRGKIAQLRRTIQSAATEAERFHSLERLALLCTELDARGRAGGPFR